MKKIPNQKVILIAFLLFLVGFLCLLKIETKTYPISEYFPLNENDKYTYVHHEGIEEGIVTIIVKNVKQLKNTKQFNYLWQGKYNDRLQTFRLTSKGMILCDNKHLAGEIPMKVVRTFSPPLLMIPSRLKRNISLSAIQLIYDYEENLIDKEKIEAEISFIGTEHVTVEAGAFKCLHFFVRHNYRDTSGNTRHMHTYNFWIAHKIGIVKFIHTFIPFLYVEHIKPEQKTIMNRYARPFIATFELKRAVIGEEIIGFDAATNDRKVTESLN